MLNDRRTITRILFLVFLLIGLHSSYQQAGAQVDEITWSQPFNLSNSPLTSTDPFLLADPAGVAHLFWAEKVGNAPGNQPDTLMYSQWDGKNWSQPIDLFFAPISDGNLVIGYPHAVLDEFGIIHLIWIAQPNYPNYTLFYSSAPANQAQFVHAWKPRIALTDNATGTKYSIHLAVSPPNTIHVIYASGAQGIGRKEARGVAYLRSTDGGETWSVAQSLYLVPVIEWGASDTRLLYEPPDNLYASWTVWDETGNGRAIYFTRSLDQGINWEKAVPLTQIKSEDEYERDWNNMALLEPGHLVTMYEGGFAAYRNAMYSTDAGLTWTEPVDVFPRLIGENGFVEFARDSNNTLHLFYAQRNRTVSPARQNIPGSEETLWHSVWLGAAGWREPSISGGYYAMINPKVVIVSGNQVVAAWYAPPDYDIIVMTGRIETAPPLPKKNRTDNLFLERTPPSAPVTIESSRLGTLQPTLTPTPAIISTTVNKPMNPALLMLIAISPVFVIVILSLFARKLFSR